MSHVSLNSFATGQNAGNWGLNSTVVYSKIMFNHPSFQKLFPPGFICSWSPEKRVGSLGSEWKWKLLRSTSICLSRLDKNICPRVIDTVYPVKPAGEASPRELLFDTPSAPSSRSGVAAPGVTRSPARPQIHPAEPPPSRRRPGPK